LWRSGACQVYWMVAKALTREGPSAFGKSFVREEVTILFLLE
jgi:hypothetical protein